jgi:hypothetical protein
MTEQEAIEEVVEIMSCAESEEGHAYPDAIESAAERLGEDTPQDGSWRKALQFLVAAHNDGDNTFPVIFALEGFLPEWAWRKLSLNRHLHRMSLNEDEGYNQEVCDQCYFFEDAERLYHLTSPCAECLHSHFRPDNPDIEFKDEFTSHPSAECS